MIDTEQLLVDARKVLDSGKAFCSLLTVYQESVGDDEEALLEQIQGAKNDLNPNSDSKVVFQFPDIDYSASCLANLPSQEIVAKIKEKTGVDISSEGGGLNVQLFRNFAIRYLLAQFWTGLIGKPDGVVSSQTSGSGEVAYFDDKRLDEVIHDLVINPDGIALASSTAVSFLDTTKEKSDRIKFYRPENIESAVIALAMTEDMMQPAKVKSILCDIYNAGKKINWSNFYRGKEYVGILELPKHPLYQKKYWI